MKAPSAYTDFAAIPRFAYDLIMADPPWAFENWSAKGEAKNAKAHYGCMGVAEIAALPVGHIASRDCLLWLWATNPMLPVALEVLSAWGFRFATAGHWVKRGASGKLAFGPGYHLRCAGEPFLIGVIGAPKTTNGVRSVIEAPRREHSRKPDEAFAAAEALIPDARRIEVFGRQVRPGWDVFGNEIDKFGGAP